MLNDFVDRCVWAADLSPEQRERVRRAMVVHEYSQGEYVSHKGDKAEHWMGVLEGIVKITTVSPSGKSVTFTGVPTGGWFGEGAVLKSEIRKYDVMALRRSTIAFLPLETFQWLLETSLPFTRFLLTQLNERLGQFIAAVEYERSLDIDSRVARAVSSLFNEHLYPGIGKTLGYLAPASLWAEGSGGTVWVSTYTKNPQRQLRSESARAWPEARPDGGEEGEQGPQ